MLQKQEQKCQHYKLKRTILHSNSFSAHPLHKESVYERLHSVSYDQVPGQIALIFAPMRIKILDSETQKFSSKFVDQGLKRLKMAYNIVRVELNQLKWWIGMVTFHVTKCHTVEYRKKIIRYSFVQL
jgi:hypothetical protein